MTKEWNIKTENTFSILQEEDTESLWEVEESPQVVKTDTDEKKIYEEKWRERIRKVHRESKTRPKPGLPKTTPTKRPKIKIQSC